ncbi:glucose dehydrogenase [FAD, quinone]-like isoform X2 [Plodia interpunctella]|uniref:glucose dehydrogenase [FAD, quinone]-like isoform X2 n=1 Tax=Plodia interpunctella TaxID=58824 RepID=UPI00236746E6|nr:glucose dehydrogenase [FAD, quinone]-like isoform X2 [Plodia interpunctella]
MDMLAGDTAHHPKLQRVKMILAAQDCQCPLVTEGPSLTNSPICSGTILFMVLLEQFLNGRCDIASPCKRLKSVKRVDQDYDFIVVGAGSAGSIVAGRLAEDEKFKVLLIEAGGPEPIGAKVPSFYRTFWDNEQVDWKYRTVPSNYCLDQKGKGCWWPRGKVIGGSSVLNGMMYHRGHAADYEDWVNAGAKGWSWEENLPYFDMTEGNKQIGSLVSAKHHSDTGPLPVQQFNDQPKAVYRLLDAINETGLPVVTDLNDPDTPAGFAIAQAFNLNGQRYTTARAYLEPKQNLHVLMNAHVSRVLVDGKQAVGVEYIDQQGKQQTVKTTKEVILSAGALNSPHILLLSGIGPKDTLDKFNIPVIQDLPVGQNLRNHYGITLNFLLTKNNNTNQLDWQALTEYLLKRDGPMSSTAITQVTGLMYSSLADKSRRQPDIQMFFNGFYADCSRDGVVGERADCSQRGRNISANAALLLPRSIGYMTLNSSDPLDYPLFYPEYFTRSEDVIMIRDAARYLQRIFESKTLQDEYGIILDPEYAAPCSEAGAAWSEPWLDCMALQHTDPQNHQLGTAAIARVLDTDLRVYNVTGLRVIDASSMPTQPTGNPQAAIMMVAERGAHLIKQEWSKST